MDEMSEAVTDTLLATTHDLGVVHHRNAWLISAGEAAKSSG